MFEFQMDLKDSVSVNEKKAKELAIFPIHDRRLRNPKYRVEAYTPSCLEDSLEYIGQAFYFPPLYVWLNGEKIDPTKQKFYKK